uniref:XamI restriction endonuclease n=1 Tax=Candidatus Kentrum sp. DK TaxID=2126562 RepID=A0A450SRL8_9GAMM|nr:MAG: hypothetical protein BECKDK2373B_GA0170837_10599 [Candidatus Kentron sp. DK]
MPFPFEVSFEEVERNIDHYVDAVFSGLQSEFLGLPKGPDFIEYPVFERGYEALKKATGNFRELSPEPILEAVYQLPITLTVLRAMLGFTPPEWAYIASERTGLEISQNAARALDRKIRAAPATPIKQGSTVTDKRIRALVETACQLLTKGAPKTPENIIHRLDKADTREGAANLRHLADFGVPYAMLLYERYLGRPFAAHRDAVSDIVGDVLESAIEKILHENGISYRKMGRAQKIPGFDQAPDFVIPDEFNPRVVIEAKVTEDDGTARDKVTRVQHLATLAMEGQPPGEPRFQVVAVIAGRGFKVRREDMKKLLIATRGKVFTLQNLERLVESTGVGEFGAM